jgi:hypothetical protein
MFCIADMHTDVRIQKLNPKIKLCSLQALKKQTIRETHAKKGQSLDYAAIYLESRYPSLYP